jgi:hypothetical protein
MLSGVSREKLGYPGLTHLVVYLVFAFALTACAHPSEGLPDMTLVERDVACQKARNDEDIFCYNSGSSHVIRDKKCWEAFRNIKRYCK